MENKIVKIENNKLTMTEKDREELKKLIQINLESELRIKEIKAQYMNYIKMSLRIINKIILLLH